MNQTIALIGLLQASLLISFAARADDAKPQVETSVASQPSAESSKKNKAQAKAKEDEDGECQECKNHKKGKPCKMHHHAKKLDSGEMSAQKN